MADLTASQMLSCLEEVLHRHPASFYSLISGFANALPRKGGSLEQAQERVPTSHASVLHFSHQSERSHQPARRETRTRSGTPKDLFSDRHRARPDLVARGAPIISGSSHITSSARANPLCGGPPNADQADPPPPPAVLPTKAQQAPPRRRPPGVATTIGEGRTLSSPSSICWLQAWSRTPGRKVPRVTIRALQQQRQFR